MRPIWPIYPFTFWTGPFPIEGMSGHYLLLPCFVVISTFNANNIDPNQMPHAAESDLGLHCLQWSYLLDARHKWVKRRLKKSHKMIAQRFN